MADLTPRQREALWQYARTESYKVAADRMGIHYRTFHAHLSDAYARLGADGHFDALKRMGWLRIPEGPR